MRFTLSILLLATLPFAPADSARAGSHTAQPVAEIVTFRLKEGIDEVQFLSDAQATNSIVRSAPGFVSRQLT